jgi:hypothetical protein
MRTHLATVATAIVAASAFIAAPCAAQRTGQLVSAEPLAETPPGTQAWRVRYLTRTDRGDT